MTEVTDLAFYRSPGKAIAAADGGAGLCLDGESFMRRVVLAGIAAIVAVLAFAAPACAITSEACRR